MKAPPGAAEGGVKMPPGEGERKEVAAVKVILEGDPKEIAALVLAVQERHETCLFPCNSECAKIKENPVPKSRC